MSDVKQRILRKLAGDLSQGTDWVLDKLDRPGRATRAGISAYQNDEDVMDAIGAQLGENPPEAPSGADIADKFGEDYDVENPYALAGIATAADFLDPTMAIPGGQLSKGAKAAKMVGKSETVASLAKKLGMSEEALMAFRRGALARKAGTGETAAEILKKAPESKYGKVAVVPDANEQAMMQMKRDAFMKMADTPKPNPKAKDIRETDDFKKHLQLIKGEEN